MTNQEILKRAISRAVDNGWSFAITDDGFRSIHSWSVHEGLEVFWRLSENSPTTPVNVFQLIYDHDFAKALWGEEDDTSLALSGMDTTVPWEYHLQQMVIADDPIEYLGQNI